jgi:hypothetical protein
LVGVADARETASDHRPGLETLTDPSGRSFRF